MLGRILRGGKVDIIEGRDVDGQSYEVAKVELELADGRVTSGYIPVVEGDDVVEILPIADTHIEARSDAYGAINGGRRRCV